MAYGREADPHGDRYDCPREATAGGHLTDDELANYVYMDGLGEPDVMPGFPARELGREGRLTMMKDRIRWLSRRLAAAQSAGTVQAEVEAQS